MRRMTANLAIVVSGALVLAAQPTSLMAQRNTVLANGGLLHTLEASPVMGEPYSAIEVSKLVRTLADGATIKKGPGAGHAVMRDSNGRVRIEKRLTQPHGGDPGTLLVFVLDPVAHRLLTWNTEPKGERVALEIQLSDEKKVKPATRVTTPSREDGRPAPTVKTEDLGTEMLENVPVQATKTTTLIPAGRAGNDLPITRTSEVWVSPELQLVMKQQVTDPRTGEVTVWMSNLSRAEPDASLFRAPAGYTVKTLKQTMEEMAQRVAQMPE